MATPPHPLDWDEAGQARSALYDDLFFSREDGLAETRHVFLDGNRLPERLQALRPDDRFIVGELGFGSGLNVLATIDLWRSCAPAGASLRLFSFEKHLLEPAAMERMLSPWPHLLALADPLLQALADSPTGDVQIAFERPMPVRLHILVGDAAERIGDMPAPADAWFLDGFSPARNADLWSTELMAAMAEKTAAAGTFATYTAAGWGAAKSPGRRLRGRKIAWFRQQTCDDGGSAAAQCRARVKQTDPPARKAMEPTTGRRR